MRTSQISALVPEAKEIRVVQKRGVQVMIGWHGHTDFEYCQRF